MKVFPSTIKFVLDNEIKTIDFNQLKLKPTTTVLNYLRSLPGHKGVKEGCAEGDCGACTVVIASLDNRGNLEYKSVDSCLVFLPIIHGKQLITIENLAQQKDGFSQLHPVQQAMIENDGSQCGYCTPGIVMSMFALYKNHDKPSTQTITDALTGNLCRCTGYSPIVDAAKNVFRNKKPDHFSEGEKDITALLKEINGKQKPLEIFACHQQYLKPFTIGQALQIREENPDAMIISGSTDAALLQTKKRLLLSKILDLSGVDEMNFIVEDHSRLAIGAVTSLEELYKYASGKLPYLSEILEVFGSLQIRNMATIGGNIGTASPIGDLLPVLFALECEIRLMGNDKRRNIPIEQFITGYRQTAIEPDEIIVMITFKKPGNRDFIKSYKISKRKDLDISSVSACFRIKQDETGIIEKAVFAFGGVAATTVRATKTEAFLMGKTWKADHVEAAAKLLEREFTPITDARSSAEARSLMARNLLIKFWNDTNGIKNPMNHESNA